ncbi:STE3-domain-containing protein [Earliella scabrosa]|nr:STE3-domain-containing protein [Earliella scabrosa]
MRIELPTVSFLCLGLLLLLSPVFLHSRNLAVISLVAWLVFCNLISGINAVVWAGNVHNHAPVWCDITTRVLLAAQMGLPGCALVLARRLRRCAIGQEVAQKAYTLMQDLTFCLIIPLVYVILHVIVQPHRFDIVADFGCAPSIYTSSVSIILIWIPPLVICIATLAYAFLAIRGRLDGSLVFFSHMQDSPRLNIFAFIRPLLTAISIAVIALTATVFALYARTTAVGGLNTWSVDSWNAVHAHMTEVFVVPSTSRLDFVRIEVEWWVAPASSFVLIAMTMLGLVCRATDDSSRGYQVLMRWFRTTLLRQPLPDPLVRTSSKGFRPQVISSTPSSPTLVGDRKSLFDDVWTPPVAPAKAKLSQLTRLAIPETPQSQSSASFYVSPDRDDPFVKSTLTYIESPTGREALGLPPLPPALYSPPPQRPDRAPSAAPPAAPVAPTASAPKVESEHMITPARPDSILTAPWPQPPSSVPSSPRTPSPKTSVAPINVHPPSPTPIFASSHGYERPASVMSIPTSLASSTLSMGAYGPYGSYWEDVEPHVVPFQASAADTDTLGPGLVVPKHIRKMRSRDVLLPRSLSARERRRQGSNELSGGIYMTVVKETV